MKLHNLKIKKEYMDAIYYGDKKFELRKNDRDFQVGDMVEFTVIDDFAQTKHYYYITYILKDVPQYGLDKDYCIFGIKPIQMTVHNETEFILDNKKIHNEYN